jgi:hypothetical protein
MKVLTAAAVKPYGDTAPKLPGPRIYRVVGWASHASLLFTEPDAAGSSVAIAEVLSSVRTGRPLHP